MNKRGAKNSAALFEPRQISKTDHPKSASRIEQADVNLAAIVIRRIAELNCISTKGWAAAAQDCVCCPSARLPRRKLPGMADWRWMQDHRSSGATIGVTASWQARCRWEYMVKRTSPESVLECGRQRLETEYTDDTQYCIMTARRKVDSIVCYNYTLTITITKLQAPNEPVRPAEPLASDRSVTGDGVSVTVTLTIRRR